MTAVLLLEINLDKVASVVLTSYTNNDQLKSCQSSKQNERRKKQSWKKKEKFKTRKRTQTHKAEV